MSGIKQHSQHCSLSVSSLGPKRKQRVEFDLSRLLGILRWHKQESRERTAAVIDVPREGRAIVFWQWSHRLLRCVGRRCVNFCSIIGVFLPRYRTICIACVGRRSKLLLAISVVRDYFRIRYPLAACCQLKGCSSEQPLLFWSRQ